ncbi:hypothetical protein FQN60_002957 [Etheostoma spectabile]|uniref:Uncharacterized protein n=1 Tax=Etheostoma spectabile TaxID=54343 RepID=A0A5J5CLA8_9PERO|nr:hypothetical protein FQN60_002957 [Etheostoma spectabile]
MVFTTVLKANVAQSALVFPPDVYILPGKTVYFILPSKKQTGFDAATPLRDVTSLILTVLFGFLNAGKDFPKQFFVLRLVKVILKVLHVCQSRTSGSHRGSLDRLVSEPILLLLLQPQVAAPQQLVVLHLQGTVLSVDLVEQRDAAILHHLGSAYAGALVVIDPVGRVGHLGRLHQPLAVRAPPDPGAFLCSCISLVLFLRVEEHRVGQQAVEDVRSDGSRGGIGFPELTKLLGLTLQLSRSGLKQRERERERERETYLAALHPRQLLLQRCIFTGEQLGRSLQLLPPSALTGELSLEAAERLS